MNNSKHNQKLQNFLIKELFLNYKKIITNYEKLVEQLSIPSENTEGIKINYSMTKIFNFDINRRKNHIKRIKKELNKVNKNYRISDPTKP